MRPRRRKWVQQRQVDEDLAVRLRRAERQLHHLTINHDALERRLETMANKQVQAIIDRMRNELQVDTNATQSAISAIQKMAEEIKAKVDAIDPDDVDEQQIADLKALVDGFAENSGALGTAVTAGTVYQPPGTVPGTGTDVGQQPDGTGQPQDTQTPGDNPTPLPDPNAGTTGPGATGPGSDASRQIDESGGQQRGASQDAGINPGNPNIAGLQNDPNRT